MRSAFFTALAIKRPVFINAAVRISFFLQTI
jgi:hypothetical protein